MLEIHVPSNTLKKRQRRLQRILFCVWLVAAFGPSFFARQLNFDIGGSPFHFWMASQGSILVFIAIVAVYAGLMNRWEAQDTAATPAPSSPQDPLASKPKPGGPV
jgi:putative solute:sodium symporter small subunit